MSSHVLRLASSSAARSSSIALRFKSRPRESRNIHKRCELPYDIEGGLGDFLPPAALKVVAIDYQEGLLKRLDEEVRGSPEAVESVAQTVVNTGFKHERVLAFNYASLALNNDFFLRQLRPPPPEGGVSNDLRGLTPHLKNNIREQYGTLVQLKSTFASTAMGMFTSGFVWLVTDRNGKLGVVPTLGPGTLLIRSRQDMVKHTALRDPSLYEKYGELNNLEDLEISEDLDLEDLADLKKQIKKLSNLNEAEITRYMRSPTGSPTSPISPSPSSPVSGVPGGKQPPSSPNILHPRFMSSSTSAESLRDITLRKADSVYNLTPAGSTARIPRSKVTDVLHLGETLHPLFCLSVHEHAWMAAGYGVWGKEAWLKQFWTVVDWEKVSEAYEKVYPNPSPPTQ